MKRKRITQRMTNHKDEFLSILTELLNIYDLQHYDIETNASDLLGVDLFYITVFKK